jgi:D-proline reductase (dithiol) PrdB
MLEIIEKQDEWSRRFGRWRANDALAGYPWVENVHAPLTPMRRALPLLNVALISSAGGHIDGTDAFDTASSDTSFREIPVEVGAEDIRYAAKGYDPKDVNDDRNCQVPIDRLLEYQANAVIGNLNNVWWSVSSYIPDAARVADELGPALAERLHRYDVQGALLIPASKLCHQTVGIIARVLENAGIPSMTISVDTSITDRVRPPRTAYYHGELGSVAGKPNWREYQLRILDESLRWLETFDQPGSRKLAVDLETHVEAARGER